MRKRIVLAVAALLLIAAALLLRKFVPLGRLGTGYAAEVTCACVFVSGRTLDSCRGDPDPLAQKIVSIRIGSDDVRTSPLALPGAGGQYTGAAGAPLVEERATSAGRARSDRPPLFARDPTPSGRAARRRGGPARRRRSRCRAL